MIQPGSTPFEFSSLASHAANILSPPAGPSFATSSGTQGPVSVNVAPPQFPGGGSGLADRIFLGVVVALATTVVIKLVK